MKHHIVYKTGGRVANTGIYSNFYNAQESASKLPIDCDVVPLGFECYDDYKIDMVRKVNNENLQD